MTRRTKTDSVAWCSKISRLESFRLVGGGLDLGCLVHLAVVVLGEAIVPKDAPGEFVSQELTGSDTRNHEAESD